MSKDLTEEEISAASEAIQAKASTTTAVDKESDSSIARAQFMQLENKLMDHLAINQDAVKRMYDIKVHLEVVLGKSKMPLSQILKLQSGSVIELDKLAGEPVEIFANGKLIAQAEIVVIDDNFGVKIVEIVKKAV